MWTAPPDDLRIYPGEVHLWRISLNRTGEYLKGPANLISEDEIQRAGEFYFDRDSRRYIISRGSLRKVLSFYLEEDPQTLRFHRTVYGKPFLAAPLKGRSIQFNISHSGDAALIAVADDRRVGVDIERVREIALDRMEAIIENFFSHSELLFLNSSTGNERVKNFFTLWTRKEAVIKAQGKGIAAVKIMFKSKDTIETFEGANVQWFLKDLKPFTGYAGAVCVEGKRPDWSYWDLI